jgi:hypothetical protein
MVVLLPLLQLITALLAVPLMEPVMVPPGIEDWPLEGTLWVMVMLRTRPARDWLPQAVPPPTQEMSTLPKLPNVVGFASTVEVLNGVNATRTLPPMVWLETPQAPEPTQRVDEEVL